MRHDAGASRKPADAADGGDGAAFRVAPGRQTMPGYGSTRRAAGALSPYTGRAVVSLIVSMEKREVTSLSADVSTSAL